MKRSKTLTHFLYWCRLHLATLQCAGGDLEQKKGTPKETRDPTVTIGPWKAKKRLTWHQIEHLKTLRQLQPEEWTVGKLSRAFGISSSAVNRILRSKFEPSSEVKKRQDRRAEQQKLERRRRGRRNYFESQSQEWHHSNS